MLGPGPGIEGDDERAVCGQTALTCCVDRGFMLLLDPSPGLKGGDGAEEREATSAYRGIGEITRGPIFEGGGET